MDQLYIRYFAPLAKFFENMTLRADLVEELINDTMLEVWKAGQSIRANASVLLAIMRLAYSRVQIYFAEASDVHDWEQSKSMLATATPSDLRIFLSKLPVEERVVLQALTPSVLMLLGGAPIGPRFIEWNFEGIAQAKADWKAPDEASRRAQRGVHLPSVCRTAARDVLTARTHGTGKSVDRENRLRRFDHNKAPRIDRR
jgi:hypothetical protein